VLGLRAGGFSGGIIIVFGTDKDAEVTVHDYLEAGADEFLRKPLSEGILFVRIRTLLQRKNSSSLLEAAYAKLAENVGLLRHELATPLSVLQMSIASLTKPDFDSEKLESIAMRCERQVAKMLAILASFQPTTSFCDSASNLMTTCSCAGSCNQNPRKPFAFCHLSLVTAKTPHWYTERRQQSLMAVYPDPVLQSPSRRVRQHSHACPFC